MSGIDGSYSGSCIACLAGTDTGIAFVGEAEWCAAGLIVLGIENDVAMAIVRERFDTFEDTLTLQVRCCQQCADPLPVGLLATGVPYISPEVAR